MVSVSLKGIEEAYERIQGKIHETPLISSEQLNEIAGCEILFKCEHLQKTGSFKARGATNAVLRLKEEGNVAGVITHSSGNHGQGLAWAAKSCGLPCCVVVPNAAPKSKLEAMAGYGARLELCGNTIADRESGCAKFARELNYGIVEPFNSVDVIHGQGTLGLEIVRQAPDVDAVFVAVGGGGMASGVATYIGETRADIKVYLVEPVGKKLGAVLENGGDPVEEGDTIATVADGIRVKNVGSHCMPQLMKYCTGNVITVTEEEIRDALKLIWTRTKVSKLRGETIVEFQQRVEPSAAVPLAGLLKTGAKKLGLKKVVIVLCGGNVDLDFIP